MKKVTAAIVAATALALIGAAGATDDGLWLFPASHGAGTIAAWKAQTGEADVQGGANQALLLEKDVEGDNSAAAHVVGLEGQPVRVVALAYEYRAKGLCTATDPRWALFVRGRTGQRQYEVNLGCKTAPSSPGAEPGWIRKTFPRAFVSAQVMRKGGADALNGTVAGLALVVDRSIGFTYVDNIHAQARIANTWTFAGDNGGTNPPGGGAAGFTAEQGTLLAAPLTADEQLTQDELFASLTPEEWAEIDAPVDP